MARCRKKEKKKEEKGEEGVAPDQHDVKGVCLGDFHSAGAVWPRAVRGKKKKRGEGGGGGGRTCRKI